MKPNKLLEGFYGMAIVVEVAKDLIGKVLVTTKNEGTTSGIIVETEAYSQSEKGCHAYKGKTARNAVMFENGGVSYVYLCYVMGFITYSMLLLIGKEWQMRYSSAPSSR